MESLVPYEIELKVMEYVHHLTFKDCLYVMDIIHHFNVYKEIFQYYENQIKSLQFTKQELVEIITLLMKVRVIIRCIELEIPDVHYLWNFQKIHRSLNQYTLFKKINIL